MSVIRETVKALSTRTRDAVGATIPTWQSGVAQLPDTQYATLVREGYSKNEIVYACVEEWATDIAEARPVAKLKGEVVDGHELLELLRQPNPFLSYYEFIGAIEMYLKIAGNAYIEKVRAGAGNVVELWLMRPDRVKVIPDGERYVGGYVYQVADQSFDVAADDIIHLKARHPFNDFYGMPPLMPASGRTDIDNYLKDIIKSFLVNAGIPAGILQVSGALNEEEKGLLRRRFRNDFAIGNAGNVLIADEGATATYTPMGMPLGARGLVAPDLDEINEARIGMVYRVPQSVIGTRLGMASSSYANRKADFEFFTERQLCPEWQHLGSKLTAGLAHEFDGLDEIAFDESTVRALSEDQDALHKRVAGDVLACIISVEEARSVIGRDPEFTPGHTVLLPFNVVPTTTTTTIPQLEPAEAAPRTEGEDAEAPEDS